MLWHNGGTADSAPSPGSHRPRASAPSSWPTTCAASTASASECSLRWTAAHPDAAVLTSTRRLPVVLFSPGLTGVRGQNTGWAMDLASHGYVVVALDHPYDSAAVLRRDGSIVRTTVTATGDDAEDNRAADRLTAIRAADLRFVLDELHRVGGPRAPGEPPVDIPEGLTHLVGRLDLNRVAVAGHSIGGAAALLAAGHDPRMRAVVNLDGLPRAAGSLPHRPPVLALVAGRGTGNAPGDARYEETLEEVLAAAAPSVRVEVPGAAHLSLTDAPSFLPPLPSLTGDTGRTSGPWAAAFATRAFLDEALAASARASWSVPLRDRLARVGEVTLYESE